MTTEIVNIFRFKWAQVYIWQRVSWTRRGWFDVAFVNAEWQPNGWRRRRRRSPRLFIAPPTIIFHMVGGGARLMETNSMVTMSLYSIIMWCLRRTTANIMSINMEQGEMGISSRDWSVINHTHCLFPSAIESERLSTATLFHHISLKSTAPIVIKCKNCKNYECEHGNDANCSRKFLHKKWKDAILALSRSFHFDNSNKAQRNVYCFTRVQCLLLVFRWMRVHSLWYTIY